MSRLAVDIAIVPPPEIRREAQRMNRELARLYGPKVVLGEEDFVPHITLMMGVLDEANLPDLTDALQKLARMHRPLTLAAGGVRVEPRAEPADSTSTWIIEKSLAIQRLHDDVLDASSPFLSEDAAAEMFLQPPAPQPGSMEFVRRFRSDSARGKYFPHVTLGKGEGLPQPERRAFTASCFGLYHLGNFCTCRKRLAQFDFLAG